MSVVDGTSCKLDCFVFGHDDPAASDTGAGGLYSWQNILKRRKRDTDYMQVFECSVGEIHAMWNHGVSTSAASSGQPSSQDRLRRTHSRSSELLSAATGSATTAAFTQPLARQPPPAPDEEEAAPPPKRRRIGCAREGAAAASTGLSAVDTMASEIPAAAPAAVSRAASLLSEAQAVGSFQYGTLQSLGPASAKRTGSESKSVLRTHDPMHHRR